ncbi:MAG TPA: radical SAM protein, partial [Isosphaeraceae bacterium]
VIPGLNDGEIPAILAAARAAGARAAAYTMLRLPLAVAPVFREWLQRCYPGQAGKVEGRIRSVRGGQLNSAAFGDRMVGSGAIADQIAGLFRVFARKHGLDAPLPPLDGSRFRPPGSRAAQLWLF